MARKAGKTESTVRILLIEDNPADVVLLRHMLRQVPDESFELVSAASLSEGLAMLQGQEQGPFDVVLLDLTLPDSQGLDTVRRANEGDGSCPVIVLTGVSDAAVGVEAVREGAQDYLIKGELNGWQLWRTIHYSIERKIAAEELKALNATLEQRVAERTATARRRAQQLERLSAELTGAEQRERRRLAHVLHDHLQQLLVAIRMRGQAAANRAGDEPTRQALRDIDALVGESLEAARDLMIDLSPPVLDRAGLPGALEWLAGWMRSKHGLTVEACVDPEADLENADLRAFVFQAVRELLFNVVKHAGVERAELELARADGAVRVTVADAGAGFRPGDWRQPGQAHEHFGLATLRDRLDVLGGRMEIESSPGQGTRTTLSVPVPSRGG